MIIADTSGLLALFNRRDESHERVADFLSTSSEVLVVSPFVIAELDYLIMTRIGVAADLAVIRELAGGAYEIATLTAEDLTVCSDIISAFSDQKIGVTGASLVVLAKRFRTTSILTLDHRHFTVLRPLDGGTFTLLP